MPLGLFFTFTIVLRLRLDFCERGILCLLFAVVWTTRPSFVRACGLKIKFRRFSPFFPESEKKRTGRHVTKACNKNTAKPRRADAELTPQLRSVVQMRVLPFDALAHRHAAQQLTPERERFLVTLVRLLVLGLVANRRRRLAQ